MRPCCRKKIAFVLIQRVFKCKKHANSWKLAGKIRLFASRKANALSVYGTFLRLSGTISHILEVQALGELKWAISTAM